MKAILFILALLMFGCASPWMSRDEYGRRLGKVQLGMEKPEFSAVFPEATPRGAKQYRDGAVEVMEILYGYHAFFPTGNPNRTTFGGHEGAPQWFYFYNGKLVQYGAPDDWPAEPDKIVELRVR